MSNDPFWSGFFNESWCEDAVFRSASLSSEAAGTDIKTLSTAFSDCDCREYGSQSAGRVFFLPPSCNAQPGDRIVYKNRNYDLKSVRTCVNAHGEILALRAVSF